MGRRNLVDDCRAKSGREENPSPPVKSLMACIHHWDIEEHLVSGELFIQSKAIEVHVF